MEYRGQLAPTAGGRDVQVKWRIPELSEHLDNLDLEGEPDCNLGSKEGKKIRRAVRNFVQARGLDQPLSARRPLAFVLDGPVSYHNKPITEYPEAEVVHFDTTGRWDFSRQRHREAMWDLVRRFQPNLVVAQVGEEPPAEEERRKAIERCVVEGAGREAAWRTSKAARNAHLQETVRVPTNDIGILVAEPAGEDWVGRTIDGYSLVRQAGMQASFHNEELEEEPIDGDRRGPDAEEDHGGGVGAFPPEDGEEGRCRCEGRCPGICAEEVCLRAVWEAAAGSSKASRRPSPNVHLQPDRGCRHLLSALEGAIPAHSERHRPRHALPGHRSHSRDGRLRAPRRNTDF